MSFEFGVIINFVEIEVSFSTVRYYIIKNHYEYWLKRLFHWAADEGNAQCRVQFSKNNLNDFTIVRWWHSRSMKPPILCLKCHQQFFKHVECLGSPTNFFT
ncbi:hypothetical protein BWI92_16105 [Flectobacillus sp. BAB-3569]|nr:hypothetical protein BWI92_16105 [Flectobacillus sp. BAB-3569]